MFACVWWSSVEFGTGMSPRFEPRETRHHHPTRERPEDGRGRVDEVSPLHARNGKHVPASGPPAQSAGREMAPSLGSCLRSSAAATRSWHRSRSSPAPSRRPCRVGWLGPRARRDASPSVRRRCGRGRCPRSLIACGGRRSTSSVSAGRGRLPAVPSRPSHPSQPGHCRSQPGHAKLWPPQEFADLGIRGHGGLRTAPGKGACGARVPSRFHRSLASYGSWARGSGGVLARSQFEADERRPA
jgi:hypothetical protein